MNYKQKLGYTLLGAGIMAVGITIGQVITPNIGAQSNGVFDKITCRELEVLDTAGKAVIVLAAHDVGNAILVNGVHDTPAIALMADKKGGVAVSARAGEDLSGLVLISDELGNRIIVSDDHGEPAIVLRARENENGIFVYDKQGEQAVTIGHDETMYAVTVLNAGNVLVQIRGSDVGSSVNLYDKADEIAESTVSLFDYDELKGVSVLDKAGKRAVDLGTSDMANRVAVYDKTGKAVINLYTNEARNVINVTDKASNIKWEAP